MPPPRWYKRHRAILNSDIIHLRRPDGRDLDYVLHVNPELEEKGLFMVYNPTSGEIARLLRIPLYYTGADREVRIQEQEGKPRAYALDRSYDINLDVRIPPHGFSWFVIDIDAQTLENSILRQYLPLVHGQAPPACPA